MKPEPVKSKEEAKAILDYLVQTTSESLKIDMYEAAKRVKGLYQCGILDGGDPDDPETQMRITAFLLIPSETYEHLYKPKI